MCLPIFLDLSRNVIQSKCPRILNVLFWFPSNVKQPIKFSGNQRPCLTKCVLKVENDKIQPDFDRTHAYQPFDVLPRLLLNSNHVIPACCTRIKWGIHSEVTGKVPRYISVSWCVNRNDTTEHTHKSLLIYDEELTFENKLRHSLL